MASAAALRWLGNAIQILPTGTVFIYLFLTPLFSNNGQCETYNKYLTAFLAGLCALFCFLSTFTDSYVGTDGKTHYGFVTKTGLWPSSESGNVKLSDYKLKIADFFHAFLATIVFGVVVLYDANTVNCFYTVSESTQKTLLNVVMVLSDANTVRYCFYLASESNLKAILMALPVVVGAVSSGLMTRFPYTRHGVGYLPSSTEASSSVVD